jgi:hypothetical protein
VAAYLDLTTKRGGLSGSNDKTWRLIWIEFARNDKTWRLIWIARQNVAAYLDQFMTKRGGLSGSIGGSGDKTWRLIWIA